MLVVRNNGLFTKQPAINYEKQLPPPSRLVTLRAIVSDAIAACPGRTNLLARTPRRRLSVIHGSNYEGEVRGEGDAVLADSFSKNVQVDEKQFNSGTLNSSQPTTKEAK